MRRVLQNRPWGNAANPHCGSKEAAENDVLKVGDRREKRLFISLSPPFICILLVLLTVFGQW